MTTEIGDALVTHLSSIGELGADDRDAVRRVTGEVRRLPRFKPILSIGQVPDYSVVVLRGLLYRYSDHADGSQQIHSFYVATDAPSLETIHIDYMDNNLAAVVDSVVGVIPHAELKRLMDARPQVLGLIWRESLIQAAVFREWLLRNSRMPAHSAMAHLFCEMFCRSRAAGLVDGNACDFPVTQEMLGHALGLTSVHVNRTLQLLRDTSIVDHKAGRLFVHDFDRLAETAQFDPHYLHLRS